ncbi:UNVERIFIED_CONTAM: class I heat shock protein [Sesamum angustifolium]|uniref:Class I heat shock protein n=1 Tax=Sesamum angustifolium TaxID=2727405 RepID=A0AAW2PSU6_9LAMI
MATEEIPTPTCLKPTFRGLRKEEVKVELEDDRILQISGERKREMEEKGDTCTSERKRPVHAAVQAAEKCQGGGGEGVYGERSSDRDSPKGEAKKPEVKSIDIFRLIGFSC